MGNSGRHGRRGCIYVCQQSKRIAFGTGYPEYDAKTLAQEYFRDVEAN
ncbi:homoserine O-acetyltransferase/O-succinyltransferase family protein [Shigella flexneri]